MFTSKAFAKVLLLPNEYLDGNGFAYSMQSNEIGLRPMNGYFHDNQICRKMSSLFSVGGKLCFGRLRMQSNMVWKGMQVEENIIDSFAFKAAH